MCTVLVACSFQVVTQHLCNKLIQVHVACCVFFFFCYYHVAFILHSAYNRTLLVAAADLRAAVLPAERTGNPLVLSSVSLENVLSITPFIFSTHMHLYFFSFQCVKGCRCYYSFFFFFYCLCLPFSVQAGLQILTYLCDFLFFFVLWIYFQNRFIWRYQSFFWCIVVLIIVTRVLALCRDGWKQMSDLPFFIEE